MQTQSIDYYDQDILLQGYCAAPDTAEKKPAVLIAHDWTGCNDFAREKAKQIAALGYVGFALDMYGQGKFGKTKEEKTQLMMPFMNDRSLLLRRIDAALIALKALPMVDSNKIAAIGFCFGGLCVLDLARSGANIKGVVSFHGLLNAPDDLKNATITAKVLALHGFDDPMGAPQQMLDFANEMTKSKANWQIDVYGNTMHAFTNPEANDPGFGTVYQPEAAQRSWQAMKNFFQEIFN